MLPALLETLMPDVVLAACAIRQIDNNLNTMKNGIDFSNILLFSRKNDVK
jgi:hypothetical protein